MNSRERVRRVLNHRIPDRMPNGLGGCETAGMHVLAYEKLKKHLGISDPIIRMDTFMSNAVFEENVISAMEGDILLVSSPLMCSAPFRSENSMEKWRKLDLWGREILVSKADTFAKQPDGSILWEPPGCVCPPGSYFFDWLAPNEMPDEVEIPNPDDYRRDPTIKEEVLRSLEETCRRLYEDTDYALCMGESICDLQAQPCGFIGTMILLMEHPEVMSEILEISLEVGLKQIEQLDQAVGKYVDILSIAHDFGDNRGVLIGADTWREIYKPCYRKLFQGWKKRTNMKINLHSCGSIADILEDLVECGVDVLNPVQISARGMDPAVLKEKYGSRLVFWGGAYDAQLFSHADSYETVYEKVKNTLGILGKDGGYFFSGVHNLPADLPQAHIAAMLDAWKDCRNYG